MGTATRYSGVVAYGAGKVGQALTAGVLQASVVPAPALTWTLEAWVKTNSTNASASNFVAFFGWGVDGAFVGLNGQGYLQTASGGSGQSFPRDGAWHHVAVMSMGNGTFEVWVDGEWKYEFTGSSKDSNPSTFYFGGQKNDGYEWINGGVDEVRYTLGKRYPAYDSFTPPAAPLTVDSTTSSLWHLDGGGADEGPGATGTTTGGTTTGGSSSGGTTTTPTTPATPSTDTTTYSASTEIFANPDRGWFQYTETHYNDSSGAGWQALSATDMAAARTGSQTVSGYAIQGRTLVFRYFYLDAFKDGADISQDYLNKVAADLAAVRTAGCKIIPRFAYRAGSDPNSDATPANVLKHIGQLAPTLNANKDVIHAVQAGFIGGWGEWYYTNNFGDQGNLSSQNRSDRNAVIRKLLDSLDSSIEVLVRYMGIRQTFLGTNEPNPGGSDAPRLGHHNDAFLSPYADYGTYTTFSSLDEAGNRAYLAAIKNIIVGGESAGGGGDASWANAETNLKAYHWTFLNPNYHPDVLGQWGQTNVDTASRRLGYRLRLTSLTIPSASTAAGSVVTVSAQLANDGYAALAANRKVNLILDDGNGTVATTTLSGDLRNLAPGGTLDMSGQLTLPVAGTYKVYVALPDNLQPGRPEYAIRLANTDVTYSGGRHDLARSFTTTAASSGGTTTPTPTPTPTPAASGLRNIVKLKINGTTRVVKLVR